MGLYSTSFGVGVKQMATYVISCNPSNFDICQHFQDNNEVVWRQTKNYKVGDVVYIYVGRPHSRLMYKCLVLDNDIIEQETNIEFYQQNNSVRNKNKPYMRIALQKKLPDNGLTLPCLLEHGLKTVQCATMVGSELQEYIDAQVDEQCKEG